MQGLIPLLESIAYRGEIKTAEEMRRHTTFRIGGAAEAFLLPRDRAEIILLVGGLRQAGLPFLILGNGSNILSSDRGLKAAVIKTRPALSRMAREGDLLKAEAGCRLSDLCRFARDQGLGGLEFLSGIPGSVGGAVVMNAGWEGRGIGETIAAVTFLDSGGRLRRWSAPRCAFGYRRSRFRRGDDLVLEAEFRLQPADPVQIATEMERVLKERKQKFPLRLPSAGCVFKNPRGGSAGNLIELAGLKGRRIGDAEISPRHANFIVNQGRAASRDVLALIELVRDEVKTKFGIRLELEIEIWPKAASFASR